MLRVSILAAAAAVLLGAAHADCPRVEAFLYNPSAEHALGFDDMRRLRKKLELKPELTLAGRGFMDGEAILSYRLLDDDQVIARGELPIKITNEWFEASTILKRAYLQPKAVAWEMRHKGEVTAKGRSMLAWSRFRGQVRYRDGKWRPTTIYLQPVTFGAPGAVHLAVGEDGHFDALVPSRVYSSIFVDGTDYGIETLERWAWEYDLTRDREEAFIVGRCELYGMRAFILKGGQPLVFVLFRPTSLSRLLRFDQNGDGTVDEQEEQKKLEAMSKSPTAIGPVLTADQVRVWLDGKEHEIAQINEIPEASSNGIWQVQYLLQITPEERPARGVWHEIRVEVETTESLKGSNVVDYCEGSVGLFLH